MGNIKGSYNKNNKFNAKYTEEDIEILYNEIVQHFIKEKTIHLSSFPLSKGYSTQWLSKMAKDHPRIKEAVEEAREIISQKIVSNSFFSRNVNAWAGLQWLSVYSEEYRKNLEWKAGLTKQSQPAAEHQCSFGKWALEQKEKLDPK